MRIRKEEPLDLLSNDDEILAAAKISDALAHPVRIKMLRHILSENLARQNVTNKDLVAAFGYAQATISQHMTKLLIGGLVDVRKKGTSSCYYARIGRISSYIETLRKLDSREEGGEMPAFLKTDLFESEDTEDTIINEELDPEYYDESSGEDFEDIPRYL